jgi:AraC family transcriptional regulator
MYAWFNQLKNENEIFHEILPSGKYVVGNFIGLDEFEQTWDGLFLWMNEKGINLENRFHEIYHTNYKEHPEGNECRFMHTN